MPFFTLLSFCIFALLSSFLGPSKVQSRKLPESWGPRHLSVGSSLFGGVSSPTLSSAYFPASCFIFLSLSTWLSRQTGRVRSSPSIWAFAPPTTPYLLSVKAQVICPFLQEALPDDASSLPPPTSLGSSPFFVAKQHPVLPLLVLFILCCNCLLAGLFLLPCLISCPSSYTLCIPCALSISI